MGHIKKQNKRKAYVKMVSENIYHVCLEYGTIVKLEDLAKSQKKEIDLKGIKDKEIRKDYVLKKFISTKKETNENNLLDALIYKNNFNDKIKAL